MNQESFETDTPPRAKGSAATYRWAALLVLLAATIGGVLLYWRHAELYPRPTMPIPAPISCAWPRRSRARSQVYVRDDDKVASGDPLFDIDATLFDAALRNARAQFDVAAPRRDRG